MSELHSFKLGRYSRRCAPATVGKITLALIVMFLVALLSLCLGKYSIDPLNALRVLVTQDSTPLGLIMEELRLPRILLGALVGAGLGLSGLLLQNLIRNPLASPDLLGVSSGASAAAVVYISYFSMTYGPQGLPFAAIGGALAAVIAVYLLAWRQGISPLRLVLTGVGISALLSAVATFVLVFSPLTTTLSAYVWLTGSVYGATWQDVQALANWWLIYIPILAWCARHVVVHQLSEDLALGIGASLQAQRFLLLLLSVMLAGAAIAYGGCMAFVGLISPHIARLFIKQGFVGQGIMTAICGASLVMLADLVGRVGFLPADLPAGIFIAALGGPFFLWLLIKRQP